MIETSIEEFSWGVYPARHGSSPLARWMVDFHVYIMEDPSYKWMMTRASPVDLGHLLNLLIYVHDFLRFSLGGSKFFRALAGVISISRFRPSEASQTRGSRWEKNTWR